MNDSFWTFNAGHAVTVLALLLSFWAAHWANVKRIKQGEARLVTLEAKLKIVFGWFERNIINGGGWAGEEEKENE